MATVQQVRDLRAEGAPADLSPDSDMESPSMKQARELGYTASAFPDEAASPLPDIEPVFGRPRTPQPYDYTPPPNLLEALRGALPYWGQGAEDVESNAKSDVQNASDEEVNRVDPETGDTPLLLSAQYGAGDLVEMLVERGADVDITLPSGATALHYMTNSSTLCPDAVIALLAVGADPSVADLHTGATPLMYAADAGHLRLCEQLVKHGADAAQTDFQGYDAAGWARSAGHTDCEEFLTSKTTDALSSPVATDYNIEVASPTVVVPESASKARRKDREDALHEQIRELSEVKASLHVQASLVSAEAEKAQMRAERADEQLQLAREELIKLKSKHQQALEDASGAKAELDAARTAADKARTSLIQDASAHKARADEAESARMKASQRADDALERALQAEARLERAREEVDSLRAERDKAVSELDEKSDQLTALEIEKQLEGAAAKARDDALSAAHAAARAAMMAVVPSTTTSSSEDSDTLKLALESAEKRAVQAEAAAKNDRSDAERTLNAARASSAALDAALRDQGRLGRWAERLKGDRDAAKKKLEADGDRVKSAEERAAQCQAKANEQQAALNQQLKDEAAKRASFEATAATEKQRADKLEDKAKQLEAELLALAQAASGEARDAALEAAHKARLDEAEAQRSKAEESLAAKESALREAQQLLEEARKSQSVANEASRRDETVASLRDVLVEFDGRAAAAARLAVVEEVQKLTEGLEQAQSRNGNMEAVETARKEARQELDRVRSELAQARESSAADLARREQLEKSAKDAASDRDRARANFTEVREQVMKCKADLLRAEAERDNATNQLDSIRERCQKDLENLERRASQADERAKRLESDLSEAKASLRRKDEFYEEKLKRAEDESRRQQLRDEDTRLSKERASRLQYDEEISKLRDEAARAQADVVRYRDMASRVEASTGNALDRVHAAEACCDALRRRLDDLTAELASRGEEATSLTKDAKADREKLLRLSVSEGELRAKVRDLEKRAAKAEQDLTRESALRRRLHNQIEDMKGKIRVLCRVRPLSKKESGDDCGVVKDGEGSLTVLPAKENQEKKRFHFDAVFEGVKEDNSQSKLFEDVRHLITSTVDGYNVCLFAYGQTGSGKTYTMGSDSKIKDALDSSGTIKSESAGIAPRAAQAIFDILAERGLDSNVSLQMFEVYCNNLVDLMVPPRKVTPMDQGPSLKITLAEHSSTGLVQVDGAKSKRVMSAVDLVNALSDGIQSRTVHATKMNSESSRSHLVMGVTITTTNKRTGASTTGKLTLVDLAGSERVERSGAEGQQLKEAAAINKSLSALGDVINALTSAEGGHVPYRNHPLTMLMSDSVGGSAKTMMLVCSSPAHANVAESVSSFQFATRCKDVVCGSDPRAAAAEIAKLKAEVARLKGSSRAPPPNRPAPNVAPRGPATLAKRHSRRNG